jgi:hypothetical protein
MATLCATAREGWWMRHRTPVNSEALAWSSMPEDLSDAELEAMERRLNAALTIVASPWLPLRETKEGIGGSSFIQGGGADQDHEIYLELNLEGEVVRSPDERLDEVIEFVGRSAEDIQRLIGEVRRLRSR